jgi:hypothetical protein
MLLHWSPGVIINAFRTKYNSVGHGTIGAGPLTTFAEYTIITEHRCSSIELDKTIKIVLPLMGRTVSTAYNGISKNANV